MKYITLLVYIGLGLLHEYLVISVPFLIVLVGLFEVVRLIAVYQKIKLVVLVLAVFSSVFIIMNYLNMYENNQSNIAVNKQINDTINNYANKYWTDQKTFTNLIEKQESAINNVVNLPSPIIVAVLVGLIELSLAYIVMFGSSITYSNFPNFEIINGEYFVDNVKVGRTKFFNEKKKYKGE